MERAIKAVLSTVYCTAGVAVRLFVFSVHIQAQKGVEKVIWAFYQPLDLSSNALLGDGVEKPVEEMKVNGKQHTNSVCSSVRGGWHHINESFLITKLIFTEKRKYTEPDLSGSSKGFDILPPWKLLLGVEMAGINMRIMVHKRQEKGKLMNELKAECVGHRLN